MRVDYGSVEKDGSPDLDVGWLADGWVVLLRKWIDDAERAGVAEPNAMVLTTADADGRPMSRTVLCKSVDDTGITFFTPISGASPAVRMMPVPKPPTPPTTAPAMASAATMASEEGSSSN